MLRTIATRPENFAQDCRKASLELRREHHRFLGVMDVIKALLMWIETTEARARKNIARTLEKAARDGRKL